MKYQLQPNRLADYLFFTHDDRVLTGENTFPSQTDRHNLTPYTPAMERHLADINKAVWDALVQFDYDDVEGVELYAFPERERCHVVLRSRSNSSVLFRQDVSLEDRANSKSPDNFL